MKKHRNKEERAPNGGISSVCDRFASIRSLRKQMEAALDPTLVPSKVKSFKDMTKEEPENFFFIKKK